MSLHEIQDLIDILSYKRSGGSVGEQLIIQHKLLPLGLTQDAFGNLYKRIGTAPVLWSCHTDTVHTDNPSSFKQELEIDEDGYINAKYSSCLGADCAAGMWIMMKMIEAKIEGLYIFHREEETGGTGSKYIAVHTPELLKDIKYAIAFDRHGTSSVITHQAWSRCCSYKFAHSLCVELAKSGLKYRPDDSGIFTDTANYTSLIPECTNISVGFYDEHTYKEYLNTEHLKSVLIAIKALDLSNLVLERNVKDKDSLGNAWWNHITEREMEPNDIESIKHNAALVASILTDWGLLGTILTEVDERVSNF